MKSRITTKSRTALAVSAVSSLALLAACGDDPKPASGTDDSGSGSGSSDNKTIAFSPIGLQIPAMKQLSEGLSGYAKEKGYEVQIQDPKLDPQKQITDLQTVIEWALGARGFTEFLVDGTPADDAWIDYNWFLRVELSGLWPLRFQPAMNVHGAGTTDVGIQMRYDGTRVGDVSGFRTPASDLGLSAGGVATITAAPTAGSHLVAPSFFSFTPGLTIESGSRVYVFEDVGASLRSNGAV